MGIRSQVLKGGVLIAWGGLVVHASSVVRNMVMARILSRADFGIAATFGMVLGLLEFTAKMGIGRLVVQHRDGDQAEFVSTAHLLQLFAGIMGAVAIVLGAPLLANVFGIENYTWAFAMLGIVALCRGVEHIDVRRYERKLRFGPSAILEILPQLLITAGAWPVAVLLRDFRAALVLVLAKAVLSSGISHLLAERDYRLKWDGPRLKEMWRFCWPLLLTGFLMFGIMQGDQFLVAKFYGMSDLAAYAAAAALAFAPAMLLGNVLSSLLLPLFAQEQDRPEAFVSRYKKALWVVVLISSVTNVGLVIGSEVLMTMVYGAKYAGSGALLALLACGLAFRTIRIAPAIAALSRGDTKAQLLTNMGRITAIVPALALALGGYPVWGVAACGMFGEVVACAIAVYRLNRRDGVAARITLVPCVWLAFLLVLSGFFARSAICSLSVGVCICLASTWALCAGIATVWINPFLRGEAVSLLHLLRRSGVGAILVALKNRVVASQ